MNYSEQELRQAIKEVIEELRSMGHDELRSEIQSRDIGEIGSILLETGALETGPLHVAVDIPIWDEPFDLSANKHSWTCVELKIPGESVFVQVSALDSGFTSDSITCSVSTAYDDQISKGTVSQAEADDYPYSVAA